MPASIIASASSAKYAGPEPETAVTASMYRSGRRTTAPRWERHSSASARCSSEACAPAQMPAIPSWTVAGAFGIARTTGIPSARRPSMAEVGMAAATESTVCSVVSAARISRRAARRDPAASPRRRRARRPRRPPRCRSSTSTPCRSRSSAARSSRRAVTTISPGSRQPELSRPETSASPIFPQPRIAIRRVIAPV